MATTPQISTGIDILHLPTFEKILKSGNQEFKNRVYSSAEQSANQSLEQLGGLFCAKEAFIKASGQTDLPMNKILIEKNFTGKPVVNLAFKQNTSVDISISHQADYVVAVCVILKS